MRAATYKKRRISRFALTVTFSAALLFLAGPTLADANCVSARIGSTFMLPDGSLHQAGTLQVCSRGGFNPVLHAHEIYVDGGAVGLFLSRTRASEVPIEGSPVMAFERREDGVLALVRFFNPVGGESNVHSFHGREKGAAAALARHGSTIRPEQEPPVLIAADSRSTRPSSQ